MDDASRDRNLSTQTFGRWVTRVACPRCREDFDVYWAYASFPASAKHLSFRCPKHGGRVVFAMTVTWADLPDKTAVGENDCIAEPFNE